VETSICVSVTWVLYHCLDSNIQRFLVHTKQRPPRTLQYEYAYGPMAPLRGWGVSYERGNPVVMSRSQVRGSTGRRRAVPRRGGAGGPTSPRRGANRLFQVPFFVPQVAGFRSAPVRIEDLI
jgi:hypothetical protein